MTTIYVRTILFSCCFLFSTALSGRTVPQTKTLAKPVWIQKLGNTKVVTWTGENGLSLQAVFAIDGSKPVVRRLSFKKENGWITLAENVYPEYEIVSGVRRKDAKNGTIEENRWWNYNDDPLQNASEVRSAPAVFSCQDILTEENGTRVDISYPGVKAGPFSGSLRFTVFNGSNLFRIELVAKTQEPSVAYMYRGGLTGIQAKTLFWLDPSRALQRLATGAAIDSHSVKVRARNRILTAELKEGSIACFPPPHSFFWDRQLEINVGFNYYRNNGKTLAIGVRHNEKSEYYPGLSNPIPWELYNARPGTWQKMQVYFYLSPERAEECRKNAMAYTHRDAYKPLTGYKTMVNHFHMAFWEDYRKSPSAVDFPWIRLFREMGIDIVYQNDFHGGDGHPKDTTAVRLNEQKIYFEACRKFSGKNFLILPGEEPNTALGGHWDILLPKPVYYTNRASGGKKTEIIPPYGMVYHIGSPDDLLYLLKEENGLAWTTHPRTKSSEAFPDQYKNSNFFRSPFWLGASFTYLPADLSFVRLMDDRCEGVFNDMNNWAGPKYMLGEVDTYKKFSDYDPYGDFNVNYVKLDSLPAFGDWSALVQSLRSGDFFVTTGEVLIRRCRVQNGEVAAEVEWTFPLEFVEAVWSDGTRIGRKMIPATDRPPFGTGEFRIPYPSDAKWVRFSAWDCAVNGAFTQPVFPNP